MSDETGPDSASKPAIGGELLLPALAVAFALYFLYSIDDLAWEAKANAFVVACILLGLIAIHLVRIALQVRAEKVTLRVGALVDPKPLLPIRLLVLAITGVFIIALPWLGLTLGLFLLVAGLMRFLHAGSWTRILVTAAVVAISAYLMFIALLHSRLPHGPIEKLLSGLF